MPSLRRMTILGAAAMLGITAASAQPPARVRGIVAAIANGHIVVKTKTGQVYQLDTRPSTKYAAVIPASLDAIEPREFIGTAVKGPPHNWVAVEVVIVPESMRAGRVGYYDWDPLPDTSGVPTPDSTAAGEARRPGPSIPPAAPALTATSMTNGSVVGIRTGPSGRVFTVDLVGNRQAEIAVSNTAPITRFVPVDASAVSVGSSAVVWTGPNGEATLVAVGRGVTPPM